MHKHLADGTVSRAPTLTVAVRPAPVPPHHLPRRVRLGSGRRHPTCLLQTPHLPPAPPVARRTIRRGPHHHAHQAGEQPATAPLTAPLLLTFILAYKHFVDGRVVVPEGLPPSPHYLCYLLPCSTPYLLVNAGRWLTCLLVAPCLPYAYRWLVGLVRVARRGGHG